MKESTKLGRLFVLSGSLGMCDSRQSSGDKKIIH